MISTIKVERREENNMILISAYIVMFFLQIVLFKLSIRRKTKKLWMCLFCAECIPILIAVGMIVYHNIHQGPNFEGFFEGLISFGAAIVYGLFLVISVFVMRKKQ